MLSEPPGPKAVAEFDKLRRFVASEGRDPASVGLVAFMIILIATGITTGHCPVRNYANGLLAFVGPIAQAPRPPFNQPDTREAGVVPREPGTACAGMALEGLR
jgi:hypothetical protein